MQRVRYVSIGFICIFVFLLLVVPVTQARIVKPIKVVIVGTDMPFELVNSLSEESDFEVIYLAEAISDQTEAMALWEDYDSDLVIWGDTADGDEVLHFDVIFKRYSTTNSVPKEEHFTLTNLDDPIYLQEFILGYVFYLEKTYEPSFVHFQAAEALLVDGQEIPLAADRVYLYLGYIYHYTYGDMDQAIDYYQGSIDLRVTCECAYYNLGMAYYHSQQYDEAIATFEGVLERDPEYRDAYHSLATVYEVMGDPQNALENFQHAIDLDPEFAISYLGRGLAYQNLGDLESALADYNRAIDLDPSYAIAFDRRGRTYRYMGDFEAAVADYTQAIELDPEAGLYYLDRGIAYTDLEQYEEALADFEQGLILFPDSAEGYANQGFAYYAIKDYEQAIASYSQGIKLCVENCESYYFNRALAYNTLGDSKAALEDYLQVLEINPENAGVYWGLGDIYYDLQNYEEALANYRQYEELTGQLESSMEERIIEMETILGE